MKYSLKAMPVFIAGITLATSMNATASSVEIDREVEKQAQLIDQKYAVLLDQQERDQLKLDLIVRQVISDSVNGDRSVDSLAIESFKRYDITDVTEQRQLLIKLEAVRYSTKSTGNGGVEPTYP